MLTSEMEAEFAQSPVFCPASLNEAVNSIGEYIGGKPFPHYSSSLVQTHAVAYPPVNGRVCAGAR
jgi:hypothetical protein